MSFTQASRYESPGALPTHHTDAPIGPRKNSVGKAPGRSFPYTGQVTLMGNRWKSLGWWFRFFLKHFSECEPLKVRSHSKKLWIWRSEVGSLNKSLGSSLFWCFFPKTHTQEPWAWAFSLSTAETSQRGRFRVGISEGGQARTRQRKLQYLEFRPF